MALSTLAELFAFHDWGFGVLCGAARRVGGAGLDREFEMGPGSLRRLVVHTYECDLWWMSVVRGSPATEGPPEGLGVEAVEALWAGVARERDAWLAGADVAALEGRAEFTNRAGRTVGRRRLDVLLHVVNHAVHHRAQGLNMLRRLGGRVPLTDYLAMHAPRAVSPDAPEVRPARRVLEAEVISALWAHAGRATEALGEGLEGLTAEAAERVREIGPAPGTVTGILRHLLVAERFWEENFRAGRGREVDVLALVAEAGALRSAGALRAALRESHGRYTELLGSRVDLGATVEAMLGPGVRAEFTKGQALLQLPLHRTHHLAQLANILRTEGRAVPSLDVLALLPAAG